MSKYARFAVGPSAAAQGPTHRGYSEGPTVPDSERYNALLPGFKLWFASMDGFGEYQRSFFAAYGGYFDCYAEEHALLYTQLHKEFSLNLEQSIDSWLKAHNLSEDELGHMLQQARLRGDGEGDAVVGALLGLLEYEPWINSIFALKRMSDEAWAAAATAETAAAPSEAALPAPAPPPEASPEEALQQPALMSVAVPDGVLPGQQVQVTSPDGQLLLVAVPEGCAPGQAFSVTYTPQVAAA